MKLLERLRAIGLQRRLAPATLESYAAWIEQFLRFCRRPDGTWRQPEDVGGRELEAFLTHLVREPPAGRLYPEPGSLRGGLPFTAG